jgi:hypothetical protein
LPSRATTASPNRSASSTLRSAGSPTRTVYICGTREACAGRPYRRALSAKTPPTSRHGSRPRACRVSQPPDATRAWNEIAAALVLWRASAQTLVALNTMTLLNPSPSTCQA